mmetsp:Transcript_30725/g.91112  ORF Transcript_30725/g.91112 Transcript_30725/m.91112 type:complete len:226 (+) Transcript_30725:1002-1679(+)
MVSTAKTWCLNQMKQAPNHPYSPDALKGTPSTLALVLPVPSCYLLASSSELPPFPFRASPHLNTAPPSMGDCDVPVLCCPSPHTLLQQRLQRALFALNFSHPLPPPANPLPLSSPHLEQRLQRAVKARALLRDALRVAAARGSKVHSVRGCGGPVSNRLLLNQRLRSQQPHCRRLRVHWDVEEDSGLGRQHRARQAVGGFARATRGNAVLQEATQRGRHVHTRAL